LCGSLRRPVQRSHAWGIDKTSACVGEFAIEVLLVLGSVAGSGAATNETATDPRQLALIVQHRDLYV
jgi:hypothetical protein